MSMKYSMSETTNRRRNQMGGTVSQSELYRESMREHGRHTEALHDALDAIKVSKVSMATEFEDFRQLPKFSHVPLGVIHPSPVKRFVKPARPDPELEAEFSPYRLQERPSPRPEFPESLMRAPRDESAGEKRIKPKPAIAFGSK